MTTLLLLLAAAAPGVDDLFDPFSSAFPTSGDRVRRKQAAFERLLAKNGPGSMLKALARCEGGYRKAAAARDKEYKRFAKTAGSYHGFIEKYRRNYIKREKREPVDIPMPDSLEKGYINAEIAMKRANSIVLRELTFHRWALDRLARMAPGADEKFRAVMRSQLGHKNVHQQLRAVRLLSLAREEQALTELLSKRARPATLAAAAETGQGTGAAALLTHDAWQVRSAAAHGLRYARSREAVAALVARAGQEKGIVADDLHASLVALRGGVETDWPAWWKAQPDSWRPALVRRRIRTNDAFVGTPSSSGRTAFTLPTGSQRVILCVPAGSPVVDEETLRFLGTLPQSARFGVVAFGTGAKPYKKGLIENRPAERAALKKWLAKQKEGRALDTWTGLEAAFDMADAGRGKPPRADTIVVVSPDRPTARDFTMAVVCNPRQIGFELAHRNQLLRLRILAYGQSGGGESYFLQELASPYGGGYRPISPR
ncbi:MAG: hypothetical protein AAGD14_01730 [Planctomycetota bacterium]